MTMVEFLNTYECKNQDLQLVSTTQYDHRLNTAKFFTNFSLSSQFYDVQTCSLLQYQVLLIKFLTTYETWKKGSIQLNSSFYHVFYLCTIDTDFIESSQHMHYLPLENVNQASSNTLYPLRKFHVFLCLNRMYTFTETGRYLDQNHFHFDNIFTSAMNIYTKSPKQLLALNH